MARNCLICNIQSDRNNCHRLYGHIRDGRYYVSRIPSGRWIVPFHEQDNQQPKGTQKEPIIAIEFEILIGRIGGIKNNNDTHWECKQCNQTDTISLNLIRHVNIRRPTTTSGSALCPFFHMISPNVTNRKIHFRTHSCPYMKQHITTETWEEIAQKTQIA